MTDMLSSLLAQNLIKQGDFERVLWFVNLMKWLQRPRTANEKNINSETVYTVRLKYMLSMLSKNPEWQLNFVTTINILLEKILSPTQLSKVGFYNSGFIQEFIYRIKEKILPKMPLTDDLETLIYAIFPSENESLYIDCIDECVLNSFMNLFNDKLELHQKLKENILMASYLLSIQLLNGIVTIHNELNLSNLNEKIELLTEFKIETILQNLLINKTTNTLDVAFFNELNSIEHNIDQLYTSMQIQGAKTELVYLFQIQKRKLHRLRILLNFLNPQVLSALNLRLFVSHLIIEANHQKSLKAFLTDNLSLLTKKIVQANSHIGEHYVTYTWNEFKSMFVSAAGGGAITSLTVFLKFTLSKFGLVGFIKGLGDSMNYSSSFLLIQILGGTLATKQPSTTAPFMASELLKSTEEAQRAVVALLRTQFIAVLGNLSMVFPICFIFSWILLSFDHALISYETALTTFESTSILGPSPLFATFTGGLLFLASLIGGWFENWVIINRIDKRMIYNEKLRNIFGIKKTERLAHFICANSNALGANISLGFLLGMIPQIMKFLGLALDVRHITLSMGAFATSLPIILTKNIDLIELLNSTVGIFFIGLINISVSFVLAFLLASISSGVKFRSFIKLFKSGLKLILIRPWLLVVPEKEKTNQP